MDTSNRTRINFYIDGFNLYHAIKDLNRPELKWLDLRAVCEGFIDLQTQEIERIYYFSAMSTHRPRGLRRQEQYIKALRHTGVDVVLGKFFAKRRSCNNCQSTWWAHEEKRTDVNLALRLVLDAIDDKFDKAFIVSRDSDFVPAIREVVERCPEKRLCLLAPPNLKHSGDLKRCLPPSQQKNCLKSLKIIHLERAQLPDEVKDERGELIASRPIEWEQR